MSINDVTIRNVLEIKGGTIEELCEYAQKKGISLPKNLDYVLTPSELHFLDPILYFKLRNGASKELSSVSKDIVTSCRDNEDSVGVKNNTTKRLGKLASEFNVSKDAIVEILQCKGFTIVNSPNTKLSFEMYNILCQKFQGEKTVKDNARKIDIDVLSDMSDKMYTIDDLKSIKNENNDDFSIEQQNVGEKGAENDCEDPDNNKVVQKENHVLSVDDL